ncbi:MAG: CDP-alcohol phosphatidyltransferase family protein [Anaerolineae bacterium]|jgi:phosphatidylglycerophosphate synthase|nr:CDP-alcohol phosphatidyltransferase family protein [Anaerolineae bacterium]
MAKKEKELKKIKKHHRVNNILLGPLERPAIAWLVAHMPRWVTPDHLTFLGFFASVLIGVSYYLTTFDKNYFWLANLGFFLNWFGDSLDGNLARYRKIERPRYGFFIDHTIDTISEVLIFVGIGLSPYVDLTLALLALVGYQCMANLVYITTSVKGEFKISYASLGPTEVRFIAILTNIFMFFVGNPEITLPLLNKPVQVYNLVITLVIFLLFFFFTYTTITTGIKLERKDRKKMLKKLAKQKSAFQGS